MTYVRLVGSKIGASCGRVGRSRVVRLVMHVRLASRVGGLVAIGS